MIKRLPFYFFAIAFFLISFEFARWKMFWFDELLTKYIVAAPSLAEVFANMKHGSDASPPLFFALTWISTKLFGLSEIGLRFPSIVAFFVMLLALYKIVERRLGQIAGWIAVFLPFNIATWDYAAFEARPYSLLLCFSALSFLFWQKLSEENPRKINYVVFSIFLSLSYIFHYYGVFTYIPIALGELVRIRERKRVDKAVAISMLISLLPLVFSLQHIKFASNTIKTWRLVSSFNIVELSYSSFFSNSLTTIFAGLSLAILVSEFTKKTECSNPGVALLSQKKFSQAEVVAICALLVLPLINYFITFLTTGVILRRYSIVCILGFSMFVPLAVSRLRGDRDRILLAVFLLSGFVCAKSLFDKSKFFNSAPQSASFVELIGKNFGALNYPIVVSDGLRFLKHMDYLPKALRDKFFCFTDPKLALKYLGEDSVESGLIAVNKMTPINITSFDQFVPNNKMFFLLGDERWILKHLLVSRRSLKFLGEVGGVPTYLVSN